MAAGMQGEEERAGELGMAGEIGRAQMWRSLTGAQGRRGAGWLGME